MNEDQRTRLEEEVIAPPTAPPLRRFGIGAAQAVSAALALFGLAGGSIGALLRFSATNQFVLTLGTIGLAVGATALTFGAAGFFGFRKGEDLTDEREVHRRLLALTLREGSATDAEAAQTIPLADVREAAETLVRGKLALDIDPRTGTETYVADEDDLRRRLLQRSASPSRPSTPSSRARPPRRRARRRPPRTKTRRPRRLRSRARTRRVER